MEEGDESAGGHQADLDKGQLDVVQEDWKTRTYRAVTRHSPIAADEQREFRALLLRRAQRHDLKNRQMAEALIRRKKQIDHSLIGGEAFLERMELEYLVLTFEGKEDILIAYSYEKKALFVSKDERTIGS